MTSCELTTRLVPATAAHFAWAIAADPARRSPDGLRLPPGGLESPGVLAWIERTAGAVREATGVDSAWLIVAGDEAVGLISLKGPPRDGAVEIGYGVAPAHRERGHATRAVAWLIGLTSPRGWSLAAETTTGNRASQVVLERNGFWQIGERTDAEDGTVLVWRRP